LKILDLRKTFVRPVLVKKILTFNYQIPPYNRYGEDGHSDKDYRTRWNLNY